jgi:UDP-N-acetylglucosamine acyltransferase
MSASSPSRQGVQIHPTAIVDAAARIGAGTVIGPYSIIGPHVVLGENNIIAPHVVIEGRTKIGDSNHFFQFCSIGSRPQDLKYQGEPSELIIGSKNTVREYVTLQPGTTGGGMKTVIGDTNLFMVNAHVGHDGIIGNNNVIANSTAIAGHVTIGSFTIVGGLVGIHQFVHLGDSCILSGGAMVVQDVPPFCIAQGDRARLCGINVVSLERRGVPTAEIQLIKSVYRKLFIAKGTMRARIASTEEDSAQSALVKQLVDFVATSERGVASAGRMKEEGD